jgi:hypothetical protein
MDEKEKSVGEERIEVGYRNIGSALGNEASIPATMLVTPCLVRSLYDSR